MIPARRPDIGVVNKSNRTATTIDVAVPSDRNTKTKEREKYQDLRIKIQSVKTEVIPIVIGVMGKITSKLEGYLNKLLETTPPPHYQKQRSSEVLHILRYIFDLLESW